MFRVAFSNREWSHDPAKDYDPEQDWWAWRYAWDQRGREFFPPDPRPEPTKDALRAIQRAVEWRRYGATDIPPVTGSQLTLAAALTSYFGDVLIAFGTLQWLRGDLLIHALNHYPQAAAAACRWLLPAVRNLIGAPREHPEELFRAWEMEEERLYRLTLHPHSTVFQGSPGKHNLVDYEHDSHHTPISRTHLERWRVRAHLVDVPKEWKFERGHCVEGRPRLAPGRLNALTRYVSDRLTAVDYERHDIEPTMGAFRTYLLQSVADLDLPMAERRRYRDSLAVLNEAVANNLLRKPTFSLELQHVREYRNLLYCVQMQWRSSQGFGFERRLEVRKGFLTEHGWKDTPEVNRLLGGREPGLCLPREVTGLLVCIREELQLCHPQTFAEALAKARELHSDRAPGDPIPKRRGRPTKSREFSPTAPSSD